MRIFEIKIAKNTLKEQEWHNSIWYSALFMILLLFFWSELHIFSLKHNTNKVEIIEIWKQSFLISSEILFLNWLMKYQERVKINVNG